MYTIEADSVITGDLSDAWAITSDVAGWPSWDPHEQDARLDGPFEAGSIGWSKPRSGPGTEWTITEVEPEHRWSSECRLPGGMMRGTSTFTTAGSGQIRCHKLITVTGPLVPLFALYFGRRIRADLTLTWSALEQEIARRRVPTA
ncbi:SRPBCC family protein [Kribbella sp. NBC_01505]|uniref:SRPBCC family protein n=1 Tax=Kribbella sp. NBC_01505 TaxID=2903580 RepID=UPI00386CB940